MSRDFNKVILMGNLTKDPELKVHPGGGKSVFFSIAVNKEWKDNNGEHKKTTFVDCRMNGPISQTIKDHFYKGRPILVEGALELDRWTENDQPRQKLRVVVKEFRFIDSKKNGNNGTETQAPASSMEEEVPVAAGTTTETTDTSKNEDATEEGIFG